MPPSANRPDDALTGIDPVAETDAGPPRAGKAATREPERLCIATMQSRPQGEMIRFVLSPEGQHLGMIPTPRRAITLAFSGPDKKTLYVPQLGAGGPDGKAWTTPEGIRNTAMTIYRIPMIAEGFKGRPK